MYLDIIKKYNIKPKKSLGQNFLINEDILNSISSLVDIENKDIIEVWPWYWALSEKILLRKPKSLSLVELDLEMINILLKRKDNWDFYTKWIDLQIFNIDVLKFETNINNYILMANIPYYISSPILRHFLYNITRKPSLMIILLQKDFGDKILGRFKNKSSVLSLFVDKKAYSKEVLFVWKQNFLPSPKVESSVLIFEPHNKFNNIDDDLFLKFIKFWFKESRKKLIKNLSSSWLDREKLVLIFKKLNLDDNIRAEDLNIEKWCDLTEELAYI